MKKRLLRSQNQSQIIVLMGFLLAIAVFIISSFGAELAELDVLVSSERSTSLLTEFTHIKDTFGVTLNYNLVNVSVSSLTTNSYFIGNITGIQEAFNKTKASYYRLERLHDTYFDATLNDYWYSSPSYEGDVYTVDITVKLTDGKTSITQQLIYSLICLPNITY